MTFLTASSAAGIVGILYILFLVAVRLILPAVLIMLMIKALVKYLRTKEVREDRTVVRKSLGEALKEERLRCQMTQEFVAERLGVSRQAVSKWENGTTDPSTSNLLTLAKLYGMDAGALLRSIASEEN